MEWLGTYGKPKTEAISEEDHSQEIENPDDITGTLRPGAGKLFLERAA